MKRTCPFCGAPLPEEAAFCPRCTHAVNQRTRLRVPRVFPRRLRLGLLLGGAALAAALVLLWRGLPRTYDGQAEVRYADSGGAYQLVLAGTGGGEPVREVRQDAEAGVDYRYPVCLYIRRADSGDDAGEAFLRKVDWVRVDFSAPGAGDSVSGTLPAPRPDYVPEAALVSFVDFTARQVGFHFNSTGGSASHSMYDHNLFRDNGTGVLLENVPTDIALNFQDSRFEGNGIDIDNRCRHPLDIAGAVFQ